MKKHDNSNLYSDCVLKFSSHWNNGDNCSPFNLNANNAASNTNANVGTRVFICFEFLKFFLKNFQLKLLPCLLAKHKKSFNRCISKETENLSNEEDFIFFILNKKFYNLKNYIIKTDRK